MYAYTCTSRGAFSWLDCCKTVLNKAAERFTEALLTNHSQCTCIYMYVGILFNYIAPFVVYIVYIYNCNTLYTVQCSMGVMSVLIVVVYVFSIALSKQSS